MKQIVIILLILLCSCTDDLSNFEYNIEGQIYVQKNDVTLNEYEGITYSFFENGIGFTLTQKYGMEFREVFNYTIKDNQLTITYKEDIELGELISSNEIMIYNRHTLKSIRFYRYDN